MHLLLTDRLICPRCGPEFGLILHADELSERRVREGRLGCANCRGVYPIRGGIADLRAAPAAPELPDVPPHAEAPMRVAAMLGLGTVPGPFLLVGAGAELAPGVAALVPEAEIVAARAEWPPASTSPETADAVNRVAVADVLPLRDGSAAGVALLGAGAERWFAEALRVLRSAGRILLDPAGPAGAARLRDAGATILLEQEDVLLAER